MSAPRVDQAPRRWDNGVIAVADFLFKYHSADYVLSATIKDGCGLAGRERAYEFCVAEARQLLDVAAMAMRGHP